MHTQGVYVPSAGKGDAFVTCHRSLSKSAAVLEAAVMSSEAPLQLHVCCIALPPPWAIPVQPPPVPCIFDTTLYMLKHSAPTCKWLCFIHPDSPSNFTENNSLVFYGSANVQGLIKSALHSFSAWKGTRLISQEKQARKKSERHKLPIPVWPWDICWYGLHNFGEHNIYLTMKVSDSTTNIPWVQFHF